MKPETTSTYNNKYQRRKQSIAEFLRSYRLLSGLTQLQMSEYAELNRSSIIRLESGKSVSFETICKYASGLDLPLNQLFLEIE